MSLNELVLVRHGETAGESSVRYYGATDIPLSDVGRRQMISAGEALKDIAFATVIASPLCRSQEGVSLVLNGRGRDVRIVDDFREIDFGEWEGLTAREIEERFPALFREWKTRGLFDGFPGGDTREGFKRRVADAAETVFGSIELPALAVLHKGVIRGILAHLLGIPYGELLDHGIELGSIHRLSKNGGGWTLVSTNETAHLGPLRMEYS